jgi:hypothetical protein
MQVTEVKFTPVFMQGLYASRERGEPIGVNGIWFDAGHTSGCTNTNGARRRRLCFKTGGRTRARTWDPLIKSQLLYQLSYAPSLKTRRENTRIRRNCKGYG